MLAHVPARRMPVIPWYAPVALGVVAAALLGTGLALGLSARFGERVGLPAASASAPAAATVGESGYRIVAPGDSLTAGTGDARAGGYPARLARMLRERGRQAVLVNLAVPGAETGDVLARAGAEAVRAEIARASLIVV